MDSRIFGVVVGLSLLYLFYSLAVAQLNELGAGLVSRRARALARSIREKLLDPTLGDELLAHPLIRSLGFTRYNLPAYIPSDTFAHVLYLVLTGKEEAAAPASAAAWAEAITNADISVELKRRLLAVVCAGNGGDEHVDKRVARWFDSTMERLSGAYKRHTQAVSFAIACALVLGSNADTFRLAARFWSDAAVRQAELALAQRDPGVCTQVDGQVRCNLISFVDDELPVRWTVSEWRRATRTPWAVVIKLLGLLATALAVSFGAPFWFDLLKRVAPGWPIDGRAPPRNDP